MVRQYIGARYVMKVYENSTDPSSAEWESNVTYEPLTMVTYNNSSYLSKKDVPASVGNPVDNPSYWVVTGAYNGQISHLQSEIDAINNRVLDSKIIFMPLSKNVTPGSYVSGESTLFITKNNKTIMVDAGHIHSYGVIKNELIRNNITHIDYFILTHFHGDHWGNVDNLISDGYIDASTISYLPREGATPTPGAGAGDIEHESEVRSSLSITTVVIEDSSSPLVVDEMTFSFFNCDANDYAYYNSQDVHYNNYSTCIYVTYKNTITLMTGDVETVAMSYLTSNNKIKKCDIMHMPHHGVSIGNLGFYLDANPNLVVMSQLLGDLKNATVNSNQVDMSNQLNIPVFNCGNGATYVHLGDDEYSVLSKSPYIYSTVGYDYTVFVDASSTVDGNGSSDKPFKDIRDAISFVSNHFKTSRGAHIVVRNTYNLPYGLTIPSMPCKLCIEGETSGGLNLLTIGGKIIVENTNFKIQNANLEYSGQGIHIDIRNAIAEIRSCTISGSQTTGTLDNQRCINAYMSKVYLVSSSISSKGVCLAGFESFIFANYLSGSDNVILAGGNASTIRVLNGSISHTKLVGYEDAGMEVYYNEKEEFKSGGMYMLLRDSGNNTVTLDFNNPKFNGAQLQIYTSNGDLYLANIWESSVGAVSHAITGSMQPGQTCTITVNSSAKTVTIAHNETIRAFIQH